MFLRLALVAPLMLAAVLPAQLKPTPAPVPEAGTVPAAEPAQEPTPEQQLEQLNRERARLQREIQYATERVVQAKTLLSSKMQRGKPVFRAIDAGKPASAMPLATPRVERKYARIGSAEEMNYGGNTAMVMVNGRAISQASYDGVMDYLRESATGGTDALRAQRVLFDMIRIEAIAAEFMENEGEVQLSENLGPLEEGTKSFADAAKEFGTVQGAGPDGALQVTRNSIHGPYFEYVAFATPAGKMSRPFRTTNGYVVFKADSYEKGAEPALDKVIGHVVQFAYAADQKVLQQAQFKVNSGQIDVMVRDQEVLDLLPALFKPAAPRPAPMAQIAQQISELEAALKQLDDNSEDKKKAIEQELEALRLRMKQMQAIQTSPEDTVKKEVDPAALKPGAVKLEAVKKEYEAMQKAKKGN